MTTEPIYLSRVSSNTISTWTIALCNAWQRHFPQKFVFFKYTRARVHTHTVIIQIDYNFNLKELQYTFASSSNLVLNLIN